jgi:hypothetical protein
LNAKASLALSLLRRAREKNEIRDHALVLFVLAARKWRED